MKNPHSNGRFKSILNVGLVLVVLSGKQCYSQADTLNLSLKNSCDLFSSIFEEESVLEFVVKMDIKKFQKEKYEAKYHSAQLLTYINDSTLLNKQVRLKSRGIFRKEHCSFPPFWLNTQRLKKKEDSISINQKFKVVCHCHYNSIYEEFILKEYLAYKIYNILTDYSFRVRLAKFKYIDTGRKNKTFQRWGFFIEPIEELTKRTNSAQLKLNSIGMYYSDPELTNLLCMSAYMMGNTDWSIVGRHNIKLIKLLDDTKPALIPIPYDFDYAGFINTNYALPAEGTGISHVRERVYVGPCREILDYQIAAQKINIKKDEIIKLIEDFEYLDKRTKNDLIRYLNDYFELMNRKDFFKYHIDIDCQDLESLD